MPFHAAFASLALVAFLAAPLALDRDRPAPAAPAPAADPAPATADPRPLVDGANEFAVGLYRAVAGAEGNLLLSPYSVALSLGMAEPGARGATREELARVLHLPPGDLDALHAAWRARLEPRTVDGEPTHDWVVANRIYLDEGFDPAAEYLGVLAARAQAAPERVGFAEDPDGARRRINAWVTDTTRGKIVDLLPPGAVDPLTRLVLVNALYLKASWEESFSDRATRPQEFHAATGAVKAPFLRRTGHYPYASTPRAQIVEIPCHGNGLSFVVVLPREGVTLPELESELSAAALGDSIRGAALRMVALEMPKFEFRSSFELASALRVLGLDAALDLGRADFSGIAEGDPLAISAVVHQAFIAVDEHGIEAAAATATLLLGASDRPEEPIPFVADRPFLFLVRDRGLGTILFIGRVADPTA